MKKIAFIPIDNRPVCYDLPQNIINLAKEWQFYIPPKKLLGNLNNPADIESLFNWLEELNNIDIFIISTDTLAYGGLITSRKSNDNINIIKKRIDKFVEILKKNKSKVYAFSSIMRISNNNINEEEKEYWNLYGKKIFEYSYNMHKAEVLGEKNNLISNIPNEILDDYLKTRKRNFEINKYLIELKKQGIFDTLVFSKDDCAKYGLNVKEANILKEISKNDKNIFVKTGADEIPLTLLSRAINKKKRIKIAPVYTQVNSIKQISNYEDISVKESTESQIELAGGIVSSTEDCDLILLVNNFKDKQGELVMNIQEPLFNGELNIPEKPYCIADILNANGSDNNFVNLLLKNQNLKEFYGYAGWNTTGNTLGSAISAAIIYYGAKQPNRAAFKFLQLIRFLDDWAYQANIRPKIRNNPENLSNNILESEMKKYEQFLFEKFEINNLKTKYNFPWNRFFEIGISFYKDYTKLPCVDILFQE